MRLSEPTWSIFIHQWLLEDWEIGLLAMVSADWFLLSCVTHMFVIPLSLVHDFSFLFPFLALCCLFSALNLPLRIMCHQWDTASVIYTLSITFCVRSEIRSTLILWQMQTSSCPWKVLFHVVTSWSWHSWLGSSQHLARCSNAPTDWRIKYLVVLAFLLMLPMTPCVSLWLPWNFFKNLKNFRLYTPLIMLLATRYPDITLTWWPC